MLGFNVGKEIYNNRKSGSKELKDILSKRSSRQNTTRRSSKSMEMNSRDTELNETQKAENVKNSKSGLGQELGMAGVDGIDATVYANLAPKVTGPGEIIPYNFDAIDTVAPRNIIPPALGSTIEEEKLNFLKTIEYSKDFDEAGRTKAVLAGIQGRFSHANFSYGNDIDSEGTSDFFSPASEIIDDRGQNIDCDDFATMSKFWGDAAKEAGYLPKDGQFEFVTGDVHGVGHAICVYFAPNGESYVVDGTHYAQGIGAWQYGGSDNVITFEEYVETYEFEPYTEPVYSFEQYNALELIKDNPGNAFLKLPENVQGIDSESGDSIILDAGTRCATVLKDGNLTLTLDDGREIYVPSSEGFTDTLKNIDGGYVTNSNGGYFNMKPDGNVDDFPGEYYPTGIEDIFDRFTPEHITELFQNPELLALEVVGASAEALIPSILAMRKLQVVKKRYNTINGVKDVLDNWINKKNKSGQEKEVFNCKDMKDALKVASFIDVKKSHKISLAGSNTKKNKLEDVITVLKEDGELYSNDFDVQIRSFLKIINGLFDSSNIHFGEKIQSVSDLKKIIGELKSFGLHIDYTTSKLFGRGDLVSISPKVSNVRRFVSKLNKNNMLPLKGEFEKILTSQKQELECFSTLCTYDKWKIKHHRRKAITFGVSAVIGVLPDLGLSDFIKTTAYQMQVQYLAKKDKITNQNIDSALELVIQYRNCLTEAQNNRLTNNLLALKKTKGARNRIKSQREEMNAFTHFASGIATTPAYLAGPVGVSIRRASKGGVKVTNACVAAARLAIDNRRRTNAHEKSTVISIYKDLKELRNKNITVAGYLAKEVFNLNSNQFEVLCKTNLVENKRVKLSTS